MCGKTRKPGIASSTSAVGWQHEASGGKGGVGFLPLLVTWEKNTEESAPLQQLKLKVFAGTECPVNKSIKRCYFHRCGCFAFQRSPSLR